VIENHGPDKIDVVELVEIIVDVVVAGSEIAVGTNAVVEVVSDSFTKFRTSES
jgi:hypothetical protein